MMDATLGQSTQPLLLGTDSYISRGLFLAVKLFLVLAFLFALFAAACVYRRKLIREEQPNSQLHRLAFRRERGIPDSDRRPYNIAFRQAQRRPENAAASKVEPAQQDDPDPVKEKPKRRIIYTRFTEEERAQERIAKCAASLAMSKGQSHYTFGHPLGTYSQPPRPAHWKSEEELLNSSPWAPKRRHYELGPMPVQEAVNEVQDVVQDKPDAIDLALEFYPRSSSPWVGQLPSDSHLRDALANYSSEKVSGPKPRPVPVPFPEVANPEPSNRDKSAREVSFVDEVVQDASGDSPVAVEDDSGSRCLSQRGKKRDRAEAGWTLDEDGDDASEFGTNRPVKCPRKRRTLSRHESDTDAVASRAQKRGRHSNNNELDSESENENWHPLRRNHRGKSSKFKRKLAQKHCNRAIGEEWMEYNIRWKFGPNRELLRQDLVKQVDPADCMPSDSGHIERLLKPEVYVEKWFTLEEHTMAQGSCILIGQETRGQRLAKSKQRAFELNRELDRQEYKKFPNSINPDSAYWAGIMTDQTPDFPMGLNEALYNELLSLPPIPTPTPADKERRFEGHATVDTSASQPAEISNSQSSSSFVSFAGVNNPPFPPTSSTSVFSPSPSTTAHPTFQSTAPSGTQPSNISPHVAFGQEVGTLQPTNFSNFPSASVMSDTNAVTPAPGSYTTFQPPLGPNTSASGPPQPTFSEMNANTSAFKPTAVTTPFVTNFPQPAAQPTSSNQFNPTGFSGAFPNASTTLDPSPMTAFFPSGSNAHSQPSTVASNSFFPQGRELRANNVSNTLTPGSNPSFGSASDGNVNMHQPSMPVFGAVGGTSNPFNDARTSNVFGGTRMGANMQTESVPPNQMSRPIFKFGQTPSKNTLAASNNISASPSSSATRTPGSAVTTVQQGKPLFRFPLPGTAGGNSNTTEAASAESETQFSFRYSLR